MRKDSPIYSIFAVGDMATDFEGLDGKTASILFSIFRTFRCPQVEQSVPTCRLRNGGGGELILTAK